MPQKCRQEKQKIYIKDAYINSLTENPPKEAVLKVCIRAYKSDYSALGTRSPSPLPQLFLKVTANLLRSTFWVKLESLSKIA